MRTSDCAGDRIYAPPKNVSIVSNQDGILGRVALWREANQN